MKLVQFDAKGSPFFIGYLDAGFIGVFVEFGFDGETLFRCRPGDEVGYNVILPYHFVQILGSIIDA